MKNLSRLRATLKTDDWEVYKSPEHVSDQQKNVPPPPLQRAYPPDAATTNLLPPDKITCGRMPLSQCINQRRSRRVYTSSPLTFEELSFLLWTTQGVQQIDPDGVNSLRTVPSAGARHPFETYVAVNRVEKLAAGLYRFLPFDHKLCLLHEGADFARRIGKASYGQMFIGRAAAVFVWTAVPYRAEWRYDTVAHKGIALDAGHVCQNLYLASEAIGAGTCAIAAYNQKEIDKVIGVDGDDEFVIYLAPVGKIKNRQKDQ